MKWDVKNKEGKNVRTIELAADLAGVEVNDALLNQSVKVHRANARQGTHATKTRSLVSGGGKKPFKQKGTGNARQGSSRSPLMEGGGIAHGPQPRSYAQKMNRKARVLAVKMALADKIQNKKLILVEDLTVDKYSTKSVVGMLKTLNCEGQKTLISEVSGTTDFLHRSIRNIRKADLLSPLQISCVDLLNHEYLIITEKAFEQLNKRFEETV